MSFPVRPGLYRQLIKTIHSTGSRHYIGTKPHSVALKLGLQRDRTKINGLHILARRHVHYMYRCTIDIIAPVMGLGTGAIISMGVPSNIQLQLVQLA